MRTRLHAHEDTPVAVGACVDEAGGVAADEQG